MYEKIKIYLASKPHIVDFGCLALLVCLLLLFCRGTTDNNITSTIQQSIELGNGAKQSVGDAVKQNEGAKADISAASQGVDRVSDRISTSKGQAESISTEIDELSRIVEECRERNLRIKSILEEIGNTNKK